MPSPATATKGPQRGGTVEIAGVVSSARLIKVMEKQGTTIKLPDD
jgi:hypothetical protein